MPEVLVSQVQGGSVLVSLDKHPDECPFCHHGIDARFIAGIVVLDQAVESAYLCPRSNCYSLFLAYFVYRPYGGGIRELEGVMPIMPLPVTFSDTIRKISVGFVDIYNQAKRAEELKLDQIAGVGYRKALEFLIKDYLIEKVPAEAENIRRKMLGACIKASITDHRIRESAELATWIGNDETHYERRWENKDIRDLKRLIELARHYVEMDLLADTYIREMKPPKS